MFSRYKFGRASSNRMFPDKCTIYREGPATNEYGDPITGQIKQFTTKCNAQSVISRFLFQTPDFARLSDLRWTVMVPFNTPLIQGNDILQVESHEGNGMTNWFQVEGVDRESTDNVATKLDVHIVPEPSYLG